MTTADRIARYFSVGEQARADLRREEETASAGEKGTGWRVMQLLVANASYKGDDATTDPRN